jgi:hypothetical protein
MKAERTEIFVVRDESEKTEGFETSRLEFRIGSTDG